MNEIVQYQALDGCELELTAEDVRRDILEGNQPVADKEIAKFMMLCQARRLNPYTKEAYMVAYGGKASVIVSKDYFVRTARSNINCNGWRAGVIVMNRETQEIIYREGCLVGDSTEWLIGGWAEVYDKRFEIPCRAEVSFKEYTTGKSLWKLKPATMIRKVALVQALRETYPENYAGLYDVDEMPEPEFIEANEVVVEEPAYNEQSIPEQAVNVVTEAFGEEPIPVYKEVESF